jgi:hypothetical protein
MYEYPGVVTCGPFCPPSKRVAPRVREDFIWREALDHGIKGSWWLSDESSYYTFIPMSSRMF